MKRIEAIIKQFQHDDVVEALWKMGIQQIVSSEVKIFTRPKEDPKIITRTYPGILKMKIEVVVVDEMVEKVLEAIQSVAYTGKGDDGMITVLQAEKVVKIIAGKRGEEASGSSG